MGKFSVKTHYVMKNAFAGHEKVQRHLNQIGESKLSFTNSPHLHE